MSSSKKIVLIAGVAAIHCKIHSMFPEIEKSLSFIEKKDEMPSYKKKENKNQNKKTNIKVKLNKKLLKRKINRIT